jgi:thymidylate synthase
MRILVLVTSEYGQLHLKNLHAHAPSTWTIESWQTPRSFPLVIDYPEDYLPETMPATDLILSLAEVKGVAELIPDIAKMTGAKAVIAPIDSQAWLPFGLARQLRGWMDRQDVVCITPMPFCSLTQTHVNALRIKETYEGDPLIAEFVRYFGYPEFDVEVDQESKTIKQVTVTRDACCGCARFAAEKLVGTPIDDSLEQVGLHHHHYPCMATMGIDPMYSDTLLHISGNIMKDALKDALGDNLQVKYIKPQGHVGEAEE